MTPPRPKSCGRSWINRKIFGKEGGGAWSEGEIEEEFSHGGEDGALVGELGEVVEALQQVVDGDGGCRRSGRRRLGLEHHSRLIAGDAVQDRNHERLRHRVHRLNRRRYRTAADAASQLNLHIHKPPAQLTTGASTNLR